MRSSRQLGKRKEIEVDEGFKFGRRTRSALLDFRYSVESLLRQNARSSFSFLNLGIGFIFLLIIITFLPAHSPRRNPKFSPSAGLTR